ADDETHRRRFDHIDTRAGSPRAGSAFEASAQVADLLLELAAAPGEPAYVDEDADPDGGVGGEEVAEVVVGHAAAPSRASTSRRSAVTSDSRRAPRARSATSQPASRRMAIDDTYSVSRIVGSVRPEPPSLVRSEERRVGEEGRS